MNRDEVAAARAIGNPNLAGYARAVADQHPGGSLERLSAGCAQVVLSMTNTPTGARRALKAVKQEDVREAAVQFLDELMSLVEGMMGGMAIVPPIVTSKTAGGPAYLLEWHELPATNGQSAAWGAEIAWMQWDAQRGWVGRRAKVMAEDLTEVEGQNYKGVPRHQLNGPVGPGGERQGYQR
jgi:hypothetical protein